MKSSLSLALDTRSESFALLEDAIPQPMPSPVRENPLPPVDGGSPSLATRRPAGRFAERSSASPFDPDVILPAQFFGARPKPEIANGERALMLAVLEDGIRCFQEHRRNPRIRPRLLAKQAERWIRAADWDWPFSFNNLCESLDLNPDGIRAKLLETPIGGAGVAKARSSHRVYRLMPRVKPPRRR